MSADRISIDDGVMGGVPCIAGTRIPVATVVAMLREGTAASEILEDFPQLSAADVSAAVAFGESQGEEPPTGE